MEPNQNPNDLNTNTNLNSGEISSGTEVKSSKNQIQELQNNNQEGTNPPLNQNTGLSQNPQNEQNSQPNANIQNQNGQINSQPQPNIQNQSIEINHQSPSNDSNPPSQIQSNDQKPEDNSQVQSNPQNQAENSQNQINTQSQVVNPQQGQENSQNQQISASQLQPQPTIVENKIIFTHPMNVYNSPEKIDEIEKAPPSSNIFVTVKKRAEDIKIKIDDILKSHERYTLFIIYYKLVNNFEINIRQFGRNPHDLFAKKDKLKRMKITDFEFDEVLKELNCNLTVEEFELILRSLQQKINNLYSYEEFLNNVFNVQQNERGQLAEIYKSCNFYFNDYIYSFRHHIQDNKIDYVNIFTSLFRDMTQITYDLFTKFLKEIGFRLGHESEKKYLFSSLCESNYFFDHFDVREDSNILQKTLFYVADLRDMSEENFIKLGKVSVESIKSNDDWKKNIQNYTEESKKLYKNQYQSFEKNFKAIHENCLKYNIEDLTAYFAESGENISSDGDIEIEAFKKLMNNIGVSINISFDTLINQFKDKKRKDKNFLKLTDFLSIYNIFLDDNEENKDEKVIFGEDKDFKEGTEVGQKRNNIEVNPNSDYAFINAHRKFTQDDINIISEICDGIADIIIEELHDSVTNFFRKRDKRGGYLFVDEFKEILQNDLIINTEGNEQEVEDLRMFIDFVSSDKMVQGSDIIEIKYLIKVIKNYSGKDGPSQLNNNLKNINNVNNNIDNNNTTTQINNVNNIRGKNNQDKITENEGEINTSSNFNHVVNNKKELTEIIKTDIKPKPSCRSFDKIMSDFANHLSKKRKRFNEIFPSINLEEIQNNQTISEEDLKYAIRKSSFKITDEEFSILMNQFDPNNQNQILVEDLKHEIAKYQPKYFREKYQTIDRESIDRKLNNKDFVPQGNYNNKPYLLNGMHKIQTFLDKKKITIENFFLAIFSPGKRLVTTPITRDTWKDKLIVSNKNYSDIVPNLISIEVDSIYNDMESIYPNSIILSNIIEYFNGYIKKTDNPLNYNDESPLNDTIKNEMQLLFDSFDQGKTGQISFNDFYKCLKSVDHKATKNVAQDILGEHTNKNTNTIDRHTFDEIIYNYIKKLLNVQKEEKDFIMNLFREADIDKNGFLTRNQVKYLIKNKINCSLTDPELDDILNKVDINNENEIDIRDFIDLLDSINNTQKIDNNIINTSSHTELNDNEAIPIMNLNLNLNMHRKIRPKDFISLYWELPLSFIPSFIREEQQKNNLLPSSCLKPITTDEDNIFYEDISPTYESKEELNYNEKETKIYKTLKEKESYINCKIYFDDYSTGVSSPDENFFENPNSQFKVVGRILKISLFNNLYKNFVGNSISIDCIYKKEYQDRWYFEDDDSKYNNNIIIRYNMKDFNYINVIFEFVLVIQKRVEEKLYTIETSCGWSDVPLMRLKNSFKDRLKIKGGSPMGESFIDERDIRKKRIGFIPKLATLFEGVITSECPIRVKTFEDLARNEQNLINYLPTVIVCHSAAMQMISIYRQELAEYIFNHKDYLKKPIKDEYYLTNMFCKIADVPDAFRVMNEVWKEIVIDGATSAQRDDKKYLRENFKLFVEKINSVLYIDKFKYNPLDPTELPRGDIKLMQDRDILLNSVLREEKKKKFNKLDYKMENYSFKPFTIDEINGQKGNSIMDKIDEIITLVQD